MNFLRLQKKAIQIHVNFLRLQKKAIQIHVNSLLLQNKESYYLLSRDFEVKIHAKVKNF